MFRGLTFDFFDLLSCSKLIIENVKYKLGTRLLRDQITPFNTRLTDYNHDQFIEKHLLKELSLYVK